jgi:hypothetical protein
MHYPCPESSAEAKRMLPHCSNSLLHHPGFVEICTQQLFVENLGFSNQEAKIPQSMKEG